MTASPKAEPLEPYEAFSRIFERIKLPEDDIYLKEWWQKLRSLNPSNYLATQEQVEHDLIPTLKTECEFCEDPIICLFLAHWYNLGNSTERKNQVIVEQTVLDAIRGFKGELNDYGDQLNRYNQAIALWYHGLYYYYDSECDRRAYRLPMLEALRIIDDLLDEYRGIKPRDGFYKELQEIHQELMLWSERPCLNKAESTSKENTPTDFKTWLDQNGLKK